MLSPCNPNGVQSGHTRAIFSRGEECLYLLRPYWISFKADPFFGGLVWGRGHILSHTDTVVRIGQSHHHEPVANFSRAIPIWIQLCHNIHSLACSKFRGTATIGKYIIFLLIVRVRIAIIVSSPP